MAGTAIIVLLLFLVGCGNDGGGQSEQADQGQVEHYTPGEIYDAEDYNGPAQKVTGHDHESAVTTKKDGGRTCTSKKANGTCKTWRDNPDITVTSDDEDWYLVLADGTRIDLDRDEQARYPVGSVYP